MKLKLHILYMLVVFAAGSSFAQTFPVKDINVNGPDNNRINLVFLSDGFQAGQLDTFNAKVSGIQAYVLNQVPFRQYAKFFNVYAIDVPSVDSGATHPGTATDVTEPASPVTSRNTYFNSTFDNGGVHRAVTAKNSSGVYTVLNNNFPAYDVPLVLANTGEYGGTGGGYLTFTVNTSANETAVHEIGHTFGKLWDEYWNSMPGEHPNMTQNDDTASIIWKKWLNTPVSGIGIYKYGSTPPQSTWFRPHQNCKMQFLGAPLCAVCRENIIDRIYDKVKPINSFSPNPGKVLAQNAGTLIFEFSPVLPNPNTLKYQWLLNGALINGTDTSITINPSQLFIGTNTLMVVITDTTLMSRSHVSTNGYMFSISWQLDNNWPASIAKVNADNKFVYKLFPVPAKTTVNLYCNNSTNATSANYTIAGITGSIIKKGSIALQKNEQTIPFDIAGMVPGVYNLILQGDGIFVTTKLIVE